MDNPWEQERETPTGLATPQARSPEPRPVPQPQRMQPPPEPRQPDPAQTERLDYIPPGKVVAGRYKIVEEIGRGGMGVVYKVEQVYLKRIYALKVLNANIANEVTISRFHKEAQAAHRLDHPNLIRVHDFGVLENENPFLAMDFCDGRTLAERIKDNGFLEIKEALEIFSPMCDALIYAHEEGIIHRDLKPSNVMLTKTEAGIRQVKIVDFGIAKSMLAEEGQALTRTGEAVGSPLYMSPEQCQGLPVDQRSDVYSFGCTLFEALTGVTPFSGENALATMMKHQQEAPPTLREACLGKEFPSSLEQVLAKLLAKDPYLRYQNMSEVKRDLEAVREGRILDERIEITPASKLNTRHLIMGMVGFGLVCAMALIFVSFHKQTEAEKKPIELANVASDGLPRLGDVEEYAADVLRKNGGEGKQRKDFFSVTPRTQGTGPWVFEFPNVDLGTVYPDYQKIYGTEDRQNTDTPQRAKGKVVFKSHHGLNFRPSPVCLSLPSYFRQFRPDDIWTLDMKMTFGLTDDTLVSMDHLTGLISINMETNEITDKGLEHLGKLANIVDLNVADCTSVTAEGIVHMACFKNLFGLRANRIKHIDALANALVGHTRLKGLQINYTDLTDADIAKIVQAPDISYLKIGGTKVTDKGVALLHKLKKLSWIDLQKLNLTPACIPALQKITDLREMYITTDTWSDDDRIRLRRALPNCKIREIHRNPRLNPDEDANDEG